MVRLPVEASDQSLAAQPAESQASKGQKIHLFRKAADFFEMKVTTASLFRKLGPSPRHIRKSRMANWVPSIIAFAFAGILVQYGMRKARAAREAAIRGEASLFWPRTTGRIVAASIEAIQEGEGEGFFLPQVSYVFSANQTNIMGTAISVHVPEMTRKKALAIVAKYPVDSEVMVSYDPADPLQCVLEPGAAGVRYLRSASIIGYVMAAMIVTIGIAMPLLYPR
jgi:hypothetical protein